MWCPNEKDFPATPGNLVEDYWPGEDYVDVLGFDAYNWGEGRPVQGDGRQRSFEEIVEAGYERVQKLSDVPIWMCEYGTVDPDKGRWFREQFESRRFPRLEMLVYFSAHDRRDVHRDWRLDSSQDALRGWRNGWQGRTTGWR